MIEGSSSFKTFKRKQSLHLIHEIKFLCLTFSNFVNLFKVSIFVCLLKMFVVLIADFFVFYLHISEHVYACISLCYY